MGIIESWWNWIYQDLFGGSTVLMLLFGWELFLAPFFLAWGAVLMVYGFIADMFKR